MSERTRINWRQGLPLGDFKRSYRRFKDGHMSPGELDDQWDEPEDQPDHEDWYYYDDYWNPWDPGEYVRNYWDYLIHNLDTVTAFHGGLDLNAVFSQPIAITPSCSPKELPRLLSNHVCSINDCKDLESVYQFLRYVFRAVRPVDADAIPRMKARLNILGFWRVSSVISQILLLAPFWVRPLSDWSADHLSEDNVIISLVDHLFVTYPVPKSLYSIWDPERDQPATKWVYWFLLLGQGASLHRSTEYFTDWEIPKSFLKYLLQAPPDLTPLESCMFAEVLRLGGSDTEFQRLLHYPNYMWDPTDKRERNTRWQSFWRSTVRWLARHRDELTDEMCHVILRWSSRMWEVEHFTLRNMTPQNAYEAAHRFVQMGGAPIAAKWPEHGYNWEFIDQNDDVWSIRELTSGIQLLQEGAEMHHCVAGYTERCLTGLDSIFSLTVNSKRCLTIQVNLASKKIVQVRGLCNRRSTPEEDLVLGLWEQEALNESTTACKKVT